MLIVDAHEDLAWNMLTFGRDYTRSAAETRRLEAGGVTPERNGDTLLGWPDYQRGRVAVVFGTAFVCPAHRQAGGWETQVYRDANEAHYLYRQQFDLYHRLAGEHPDQFQLVTRQRDLQNVLAAWRSPDSPETPRPVGIVPLMEGAEGVRSPAELEEWWQMGVRIIGPAWAGTRFCGGTREPGPLTSQGFALLEGMASLGFILDLTHMDQAAVLQALDVYPGRLLASHANAHALLTGVESNRHLSDRVITGLIERGGVIGVVPFNGFLLGDWKMGDRRDLVDLGQVVAQIDTICQIAGDAKHVGLGTDFDGGFGVQHVPLGIDTIADLPHLAPLLQDKGYNETDIAAILGENWLSFLTQALPEA